MIYDNKQPLLNTNVFYYKWLVLILCKRKRKQSYIKVIMLKQDFKIKKLKLWLISLIKCNLMFNTK